MQTVQATWWHVIQIYWLLLWRSSLGGLLLALLVGLVWGLFAALVRMPSLAILPVAMLLGCISGTAWSLVVVRMALGKTYRGFRLALVPV